MYALVAIEDAGKVSTRGLWATPDTWRVFKNGVEYGGFEGDLSEYQIEQINKLGGYVFQSSTDFTKWLNN